MGTHGARVWLRLIFISQVLVADACVYVCIQYVCALKPEPKSHLPDYLHDSPGLWKFKEFWLEVSILPAFALPRKKEQGSGGYSSQHLFTQVCLRMQGRGEAQLPLCFAKACVCLDISHLSTPWWLTCLHPPVLMHYWSSRHHGYGHSFFSHGLFLFKNLCHTQHTKKCYSVVQFFLDIYIAHFSLCHNSNWKNREMSAYLIYFPYLWGVAE